jgi:hypothetical protein
MVMGIYRFTGEHCERKSQLALYENLFIRSVIYLLKHKSGRLALIYRAAFVEQNHFSEL